MTNSNPKIAVLGLGYVGLPLAVEFAKKFFVVGFDINTQRVTELKNGLDKTLEVSSEDLKKVMLAKDEYHHDNKVGLFMSSNLNDLSSANIFIVTVPTPIDTAKRPDLTAMQRASAMIGDILKESNSIPIS